MPSNRKIEIPESILSSERLFTDMIIGGVLSDSQFSSLKKTASMMGCSERRISQASERLQKINLLRKHPNYIIPHLNIHNNIKTINRFRADLLTYHGIRTPEPVYYKRSWYAVLFWRNSYLFSIVANGQKDEPQLTPKTSKKYPLTLVASSSHYNLWKFNETVYTLNDYLNDFGFKHL